MMREGWHPETPPLPFTPGWNLAKVKPGQRVLIHGAAGGVGSALLQLGRLARLEMYGRCSSRGASAVTDLGGIPIGYEHQDFVTEISGLGERKSLRAMKGA